jgi:hypothetical protein
MSQIRGYRGSSTLKKTNQPIEWTEERKAELLEVKEIKDMLGLILEKIK